MSVWNHLDYISLLRKVGGFFECKAAGGAAGFTGNTLALELESPYYCSRL